MMSKAATPMPTQGTFKRRTSMQRAMWHSDALAEDFIEMLWTSPDEAIRNGAMLKDGDRCTVVRVHEHFVLKRYNLKGSMHTAVHTVMRSRARWSFVNATKLMNAGLLTPAPLACVEERRNGILRLRSYLLTEFVEGQSLRDIIEGDQLSAGEIRDLAQQFAAIWRTLGQLRIGHGDMKATNFLVDDEFKLWLIDLDGMRVHRSTAMFRRERRNDLARFMRNWQDQQEVAAAFRVRLGIG